ncbi:MAG: low molecular weight protein-tyrosine-phosphatase [Pseudomonadota bacterium]
MVKVLFVCMGNICRSPTAEGVFRHLAGQHGLESLVEIDSAGTHAYHIGNPPDRRSQAATLRRGIDISAQQARRVEVADFETFDYILAMDEENIENLHALCPPEHRHKVRLFLEFAPHLGSREVPDPYYGGLSGFERVLDMIEAAAEGLIEEVKRRQL